MCLGRVRGVGRGDLTDVEWERLGPFLRWVTGVVADGGPMGSIDGILRRVRIEA